MLFDVCGTVNKTAATEQYKYGLFDKAPESKDITSNTNLCFALQMSLPPLHINLGLMNSFVKAMHRDGDGFKFLKDFFGADESDAKLKVGGFVDPEIRKLMLNKEFNSRLNPLELAAENALKSVVANFLRNHHHENMLILLIAC